MNSDDVEMQWNARQRRTNGAQKCQELLVNVAQNEESDDDQTQPQPQCPCIEKVARHLKHNPLKYAAVGIIGGTFGYQYSFQNSWWNARRQRQLKSAATSKVGQFVQRLSSQWNGQQQRELLGKGLPLYVTMPDGRTLSVEVDADATVGGLRGVVAETAHIHRRSFRLSFGGAPLNDSIASLADVGVCQEAIVCVVNNPQVPFKEVTPHQEYWLSVLLTDGGDEMSGLYISVGPGTFHGQDRNYTISKKDGKYHGIDHERAKRTDVKTLVISLPPQKADDAARVEAEE